MTKVRHVLGISGGKDSAALAIYLRQKHPDLDIEYYFTDTGKELDETYQVIENLESYLGKKIEKLNAAEGSPENTFDHFLELYGGFLPSSNARWCMKKLKLEPFEQFVGTEFPVVSYVGIRGDEDRDGYISKKSNIQSIFPFRRNIWSEEVVKKVLATSNQKHLQSLCEKTLPSSFAQEAKKIAQMPLSLRFNQKQKLNAFLDVSVKGFNELVFAYLQETSYPLSYLPDYTLLNNEDNLVRDDIFKLLEESGVGVPQYYQKREFEVDGKKGTYARSRSGCFFCFFQQKIEWVWLLENHPELFTKAIAYEKDGYSWMDSETLLELSEPERVKRIKRDYIKKTESQKSKSSPYLIDMLVEEEGVGCASCFI
ncbi:MAG: hypothetical protein ACJAWV_004210 [Flammeovirgaceae bacterium]|jgi:hypothetical protein